MRKRAIFLALLLAAVAVLSSCAAASSAAPWDELKEILISLGSDESDAIFETQPTEETSAHDTEPITETAETEPSQVFPTETEEPSDEPALPTVTPSTPTPTETPIPEVNVLYYGDMRLGVFEEDENTVRSALEEELPADVRPDKSIRLKKERVEEESIGIDEALKTLKETVLSEMTTASALYVSNNYIGAALNEEKAKKAVEGFCKTAEVELECGATVELRDTSCRSCTIKKSQIFSVEELEALIARCCNKDLVFTGVDYTRIDRYADTISLPDDAYVVCTTGYTKEEVTVPYKTETVYDETKYAEYRKVATKGVDGLVVYNYSIEYKNGVEISRTLIGKTVLREVINERIVRGKIESMLWPLEDYNIRLTSAFQYDRLHPVDNIIKAHTGIDLAGPQPGDIDGDNIYAAYDGVVTVADNVGSATGYGKYVMIDHGTALQSGTNYKTVYGHCSEVLVKVGQTVKKGDLIAKVGETGKATGPHLHFEVRVDNVCVDPLTFRYQLALGTEPVRTEDFITTTPFKRDGSEDVA